MGRESRANGNALQFQNKQVPVVGQPFTLKMFNMEFNPTTMKVECVIGVPTQKEPS